MQNLKPIYRILLILLLLIILGTAAYLIWKRLTAAPPIPPILPPGGKLPVSPGATTTPSGGGGPSGGGPGEIPGAGEVTEKIYPLIKISDNPVFDFWETPASEVFYLSPEGLVWNAKESQDVQLIDQAMTALNFIESSPQNQKVLAAFGDPAAPQWGIFDNIDKVWRPLPAYLTNATWGANDNELYAIQLNNNEYNLTKINLAQTATATKPIIRDIRLKDTRLHFLPSQNKLFFIEKPAQNYQSRIWQLDLNPKNLTITQIGNASNGLIIKWAKDNSLAFRYFAPANFTIINQNFEEEPLPFTFSTLPSKCGYASSIKTVYCFTPQEFQGDISTFNLPDDYFQKKLFTTDDLYTISDIGISKLLESANGTYPAIDAKNLQLIGGNLYFINRYDNFLYELKLQ